MSLRLLKDDVIELYERQETLRYKKYGIFMARVPNPFELIVTVVNGKVETRITMGAVPDRMIVENISVGSSYEKYCPLIEDFNSRYEQLDVNPVFKDGCFWNLVRAKGIVDGCIYRGIPVEIMTPWDEWMVLTYGDAFVRAVGSIPNDIYRIERNEFLNSYAPIDMVTESGELTDDGCAWKVKQFAIEPPVI